LAAKARQHLAQNFRRVASLGCSDAAVLILPPSVGGNALGAALANIEAVLAKAIDEGCYSRTKITPLVIPG
jgi:hypothetical protein